MNPQNRNNGMYLGNPLFAFAIGFCAGAFVIDKNKPTQALTGILIIQGVLNRVMAGENRCTRFAGSLGCFSGLMFQIHLLPDHNQPLIKNDHDDPHLLEEEIFNTNLNR